MKEYWIVDPDKNRLSVYYFDTDFMDDYSMHDKVKVSIYDDLEIDLLKLNVQ